MGYDLELDEHYDDLEHKDKNKTFFSFERKNLVSCAGVSFRTLIWNYICWVLSGKPKMDEREV